MNCHTTLWVDGSFPSGFPLPSDLTGFQNRSGLFKYQIGFAPVLHQIITHIDEVLETFCGLRAQVLILSRDAVVVSSSGDNQNNSSLAV